MEEKYYTPAIEEFHIGFECEFLNGGIWKHVFIGEQDLVTLIHIIDSLKNGNIRVKYLDRRDMIALGWIDKIQPDKYYLIVDGGEIQFYPDAYHSVEGQGIGCQIFYKLGDKTNEMAVWIKNITELRQLMKFHGWLKQE